ncbi:ABC transporter permease [Bacillus sp. FJAT-45037]|uniref:ABC transporter permease n=1 Tax=Bacillus sp. FJAT-45037 TaxID=2011007 RepID=UPI000C2304E9|nr:proline/glycine betaine ABC transporter permease [Bacillus sp. FJAT-45037]
MNNIPSIPLGDWMDTFIRWINDQFGGFLDFLSMIISGYVSFVVDTLGGIPAIILIALFTAIAWWTSGWKLGVFTFAGLLLIWNMGYWDGTIQTLALILTSVIICVLIGIPIGIWASQNDTVQRVVTPILDFMQTMPAFVYLIPSILFFGIGVVPGIFSSIIFAMPPTIRLTNLGIRQVPSDLVEAANAFGSTTKQKLLKVQLPLAMPTIMAGINQTIMLALSMVVIASLVGAPGLGSDVYRAVSQIRIGTGFEAGLAIVILAIMLDRITQNLKRKRKSNRAS